MNTDQWDATDPTAEQPEASPPGALRWFILAVIHLAATALLVVPTLQMTEGKYFPFRWTRLDGPIVIAMTAGLSSWPFRPRKSMRIILAGWLALVLVLVQMVLWAL